MARSKANAEKFDQSGNGGNAGNASEVQIAHATDKPAGDGADWIGLPAESAIKTYDILLENQQKWLKTASMGSETLATELKALQQAKDPVAFFSAQFAIVNQQIDIATRQLFGVLQQLFDTQLLWFGQWEEKEEEAPAPVAQASLVDNATLSSLGKLQDDWLKMSRSWIDSLNAAGRGK